MGPTEAANPLPRKPTSGRRRLAATQQPRPPSWPSWGVRLAAWQRLAHGKPAAGSLVPIGTARVDARYRHANERYREEGQDDVAHTSLLKEESSQPPSV